MAATPTGAVRDDLEHLIRSSRSRRRRAALADAAAAPDAFLARVRSELARFWELCVAPWWPRLQALADADIAFRGRRAAAAGVATSLAELHPRVQVDGDRVAVRTACLDEPLVARADELVLVPMSFTWPDPLVLNQPSRPLTIGYPTRGIGTLWESTRENDGLAELTGTSRAQALRLLDVPMTTTYLAGQLALTPSTVGEHLQVLARAGTVERQRRGRLVYYARTALGEALVTGGG